jgi:DNA-binding CsgD family transcriptional regulator
LRLCRVAGGLCDGDDQEVIAALESAAEVGRFAAAMFVWVVPDGEHCWYQSFIAGDQTWCAAALRQLLADSSWRQHAARTSAPASIRLSGLSRADDASADHLDMAEAWLIPAPAPPSSDAIGVLVLSVREGQPLPGEYELMPVYRALALALSEWVLRRMREALIERAHLTERDIELLRHEQAGHGSKRIAAALLAEPKTIDCRFHRLNTRLGVASRREAVRLCSRYGLL